MKIDARFVIDTNILIYYFNELSEFCNFSRDIINSNPENLYIVQKSLSEFVAVLSKIGMDEIINNEFVKIINKFNILYPDDLSTEIFVELIKKYNPKGNKVYDYEIASVMLANDIKNIVTVNANDYKRIKGIKIITKV